MHPLEQSIAAIENSPQFPELVNRLAQRAENERQRRDVFYRDMRPDQKIEFINGEVILHSPAKMRQLEVTLWIARLMSAHVERLSKGAVFSEKCLCVFPRNDYESDVVFFGPEKASTFDGDTLRFPIPDLAVEVLSKSTETRDRGIKFEDFSTHGVTEYWIVDAETAIVEQYVREGDELKLRTKSATGTLACIAIEGLILPIESFFDSTKNLDELTKILSLSSPS